MKSQLEHQEDQVRNRYRSFWICIAFALASALPLLAQSDGGDIRGRDDQQPQAADNIQPLLTAGLVETPAIGGAGNESALPDAPSATRPETSNAEPPASPVVKREVHGAPPAAMGGPLGVDREVMDRKYFLFTGVMFSASVANAELTLNCLSKHASCNDVPSSLHSRAAMYGIGIPADLGVAYLTYFMKRKHSHMWYVPSAAVTAANVILGVRAYRWSQDK
jgi:hypothetical protein